MYFDIVTNKTDLIPMNSNGRYLFKQENLNRPYRVYVTDEKKIKKVFGQINKKIYKHNISKLLCLDYHGVTDLYNLDEPIPSSTPKIVISYIGGNPKTIGSTTNAIIKRIKSKEVLFGIIVYLKEPEPICGTKGWILSHLSSSNPGLKLHFIDDGKLNIQCVNKLVNPNIITYFHDSKNPNSKSNLTQLLEKI